MKTRGTTIAMLIALLVATGAQGQDIGDAPELAAVSETEIGDAFARMDSNRDGELSLEEFEKGLARPFGSHREGVVWQRLPARFRVLDADGSGYLEAGEYVGVAARWQGGGEAPSLAQSDRDHDGRIDFREFAQMHAPRDEEAEATPPEATAANAQRAES